MTVISTYFDFPSDGTFTRLAKVFSYSIKKHMPAAELILNRQDPPELGSVKKNRIANHEKLVWWAEQAKKQTGRFVLLDTDTIALGDLEDAFDFAPEQTGKIKDIGLCRHKTRFYDVYSQGYQTAEGLRKDLIQQLYIAPFNGGAIYCNPTPETFALLDAWVRADEKLLRDPALHERYIPRYNGMNQSSFGYLLENPKEAGVSNVDISLLPAELFNVSSLIEWGAFTGETEYLLHIKAALRKAVGGATIEGVPSELAPGFVRCGRAFLELEHEMMNAEAETP